LSAVMGALRFVKKDFQTAKFVVNGCGAAGSAIGRLLVNMGAQNVIMVDRWGALYEGIDVQLDRIQTYLATVTNKDKVQGVLADVAKGADVLIGVSAPNVFTKEIMQSMAKDAVVFALANPVPETTYDLAKEAGVAVAGTGRSDRPNQVNNVTVFPGVFRGAIDVRARAITEDMKVAAVWAIVDLIDEKDLREDYVVPDAFDPRVAPAVAAAVAKVAIEKGLARKIVDPEEVKANTLKRVGR
ncbi:MAG: NAD-dependent malic enzyme, partial [Phascolarctobacterium sp.]|nr:NAD-dependent malic enzyme [Phascolarctobacterium sp.]